MKIYASKEYVEEKWIERRIAWVDGGMVELMPETTQAPDENTGGIAMTFVPEAGKTYIVNWNGTTYECLAYEVTEEGITGIVFGNSEALANWGITAEACDAPFMAMYAPEQMAAFRVLDGSALDESGNVTLSVYCNDTTIHTIDPMFLPNGVPYVIDGGGGEVIFPETTLSVPDVNNDLGLFDLESPIMFEPGTTYIINWNGTEYSCVCQAVEMDGAIGVVLGDGSMMGLQSNGEPFVIATTENAGEWVTLVVDTTETMTSTTLSIVSGGSTKIQKLDNRCLDMPWHPGMVSEAEFIPETTAGFSTAYVDDVECTAVIWQNVEYELSKDTTYYLYVDGVGTELKCSRSENGYDYYAPAGGTFPVMVYALFEGVPMLQIAIADTVEGDHTFSIKTTAPVPLPVEYLPNGVPYVLEDQTETIFAEQTIQLTNNMYTENGLLPIVLGETYTVTWDGVAYDCVCITATFQDMDSIGIGNAALYGGGEDTGEPFAVGVIASLNMSGFIAGDNNSHTISIVWKGAKVQKLDNRCLDLEWYAAPDEEVIMEPTVFSFESGMARTTGFDYSTVPVVEGGLYRVYLDGVEYDTICRLMHDETDLAARSYVLFNESHFVEVRYAVDLGWLMVYLISGASGPHTVAITQKIYTPVSIEYIPDCVLTEDNTNWLAKKEENVTVVDEWINALGRSDLTTDTVKCYLSNRSKASLDSTLFNPNKCYRLDIEQGSRYVFDVQKTVRYAGSKTTTHRSASLNTSDVEAEVYYFTATGEMPDMDNIDLSLLPIYEYVVPLNATYANPWLYLPMDCEVDTTQYGICYRFVEVETTHNSLPEEYFPEEIGSFVMRSSTEGSNKKFRVTIDDSGMFIPVEITE